MTNEPDYTLTIIQEDGGLVVCEGGKRISKPFEDKASAEAWLRYHRNWRQPRCCVCGSARPDDDPWEAYAVSSRTGPDWMHKSCMEKFESWADDENNRPDCEPGPHPVPPIEVLDAAWRKEARN